MQWSRRHSMGVSALAGFLVLVVGGVVIRRGCDRDGDGLSDLVRPRFEPARAQIEEAPEFGQFKTLTDLTFIDGQGRKWVAPAGTVTDGASIPRFLWSLVGSPVAPEVLKAAIVHDAYCGHLNKHGKNYRRAAWEDVHRMFYRACVALGTGPTKAKGMYMAVRLYVPRWEFPPPEIPTEVPTTAPRTELDYESSTPARAEWPTPLVDDSGARRQKMLELKRWIEEQDPALEDIDARVDRETGRS